MTINVPFTKEREFIMLRNQITDPVNGINQYIQTWNTYAVASDMAAYGKIIQMKNIILPDPGNNEPGAVFMLTPGQYAVNYDPFVTLTLEAGGIKQDGSTGPGVKVELEITIYVDFVDPADGTVDILLFRYLQAFESLIENQRWFQSLPRRIKELEPVNYKLSEDNPSHVVVGLKIQSDSATR
jgi:hypothetical protein